jgi:GTP:adenosylcobinamide-phosphate guanylyltransferase
MTVSPHVLILAGRRDGDDAVARLAGTSHKALVPVGGVAMLERVVAVFRESMPDAAPGIAIGDGEDVDLALRRLAKDGPLVRAPLGDSPAATVAAAMKIPELVPPLVIATADHPLLTAAMVRHFLDALPPDADAAVAVARRETVETKYRTKRTYWRFADGAVSGCNLFYLGPRADGAVAFWRTLESERKRPWKAVRQLGFGTLVRFALGRLALTAALDRLGAITSAHLCAVDMPFAEAAIDVDKPADLALAESIFKARAR